MVTFNPSHQQLVIVRSISVSYSLQTGTFRLVGKALTAVFRWFLTRCMKLHTSH